jgi:hypothetical protein
MNKATHQLLTRLEALGISTDDALALRRISMTLHRWNERECNGEVERDEETGKTFATFEHSRGGIRGQYPCPDLERGAQKRLAAIMARYPALAAYEQTDPRGAALYIYSFEDLDRRHGPNADIHCCYSSIGTAVHS